MPSLPVIHFNCKYFEGSHPCFPNKEHGVFCDDCPYYEADISITENFPEIKEDGVITEQNEKKILIIKLEASGDVLRTTSILPSLKKACPDSSLVWITKSKSYPLLKNNELIEEIYFADDDLSELFSQKFDTAVNFDNSSESCEIMNKINAASKHGYRLANNKPYPVNELACEWYLMAVNDSAKRTNKKTYHQIIHEICGLEYKNSKPILKITPEILRMSSQFISKHNLENFREFILVNLGGGTRWENKKWTKEGYTSLINKLSESPDTCVGIIAGEEDKDFYKEVLKFVNKSKNVIDFGCKNSLDEFAAIIYTADKILTSDSLALHIATALNKYTVVLVGPTSGAELDVFERGQILQSSEMECKCFYENKCKYEVNCMTTLRPAQVLDSLK